MKEENMRVRVGTTYLCTWRSIDYVSCAQVGGGSEVEFYLWASYRLAWSNVTRAS